MTQHYQDNLGAWHELPDETFEYLLTANHPDLTFRKRTQSEYELAIQPTADELMQIKSFEIRNQRNEKLDALDKKINKLEDSGLDASAFRKYRQALRDVPEQVGFPDNVTWPIEPI